MLWQTDAIEAMIRTIPKVADVKRGPPGGDHDTTRLSVKVLGCNGTLFVAGYDPDKITDPSGWDDMDVYAIEVTDGTDSSGGCQSRELDFCRVYGELTAQLRVMGHRVINHYDEIF